MNLEDACRQVYKRIGIRDEHVKVKMIYDIGDAWVIAFGDSRGDVVGAPVAQIKKGSGECSPFALLDRENMSLLKSSPTCDIPIQYRL